MKTGGRSVLPVIDNAWNRHRRSARRLSATRGTATAQAYRTHRERAEGAEGLDGGVSQEVRLAGLLHGELNGYCPDFCANSSRRLPAVGMITRPAA